MTLDIEPERLEKLQSRLQKWSERLRGTGPGQLLGAILSAATPLSPLGAQMLWIAQPVAGLFGDAGEFDTLARLLSNTEGVRWLRAALSENGVDAQSGDSEGDA